MKREEHPGRSPRATNWSSFKSDQPARTGAEIPVGEYPAAERYLGPQPYPWTPDNMESKGARGEQYT